MGLILSYRSCRPVGPEQEAAIRQAADAVNRGQAWGLTFVSDPRDGHLVGSIRPHGVPDGRPGEAARTWPGPYEAQRLLDALCAISRDWGVDWELSHDYSLRPIGLIRSGECHADLEAMAEATRNIGEVTRRKSGG